MREAGEQQMEREWEKHAFGQVLMMRWEQRERERAMVKRRLDEGGGGE